MTVRKELEQKFGVHSMSSFSWVIYVAIESYRVVDGKVSWFSVVKKSRGWDCLFAYDTTPHPPGGQPGGQGEGPSTATMHHCICQAHNTIGP